MTVTNITPPVISGTTVQGNALHSTPGTWTSTDPLSYLYQWERCDAVGANCVDISGATASSYILTAADVGHTIRVTVTATEIPSPPPPPPPSGDWKEEGGTIFNQGNYNSLYQQSSARFAGVNFSRFAYSSVANIKAFDANTKVFGYITASDVRDLGGGARLPSWAERSQCDTLITYNEVLLHDQNNPGDPWLLANSSGYGGFSGVYGANIGKQSYIDQLVVRMTEVVTNEPDWDGFFCDNAGILKQIKSGGQAFPAETELNSEAKWTAAQVDAIGQIRDYLHTQGKILAGNVGYYQSAANDNVSGPISAWTALAPSLDIVISEDGFQPWSNFSLVRLDDTNATLGWWQRACSLITIAQAAGKMGCHFIRLGGANGGNTNCRAARYARASASLDWNGDGICWAWNWVNGYGYDPYSGVAAIVLGLPVAGKYLTNSCWVRQFEHGWIAVNPSAGSKTVSLGGSNHTIASGDAYLGPSPGSIFNAPVSLDATGGSEVAADLETWLNSLPNGSTALLPTNGTYLCNRVRTGGTPALTLTKSLTILGAGCTIKQTQDPGDTSDLPIIKWVGVNNVTIQDLNLLGARPTNADWNDPWQHGHGFSVWGCSGFVFDNVSVRNVYGDGIYFAGSTGAGGTQSQNCTVQNSTFRHTGRMGIACVHAKFITVDACSFTDPGLSIFDIEPNSTTGICTDITFQDSTATNTTENASNHLHCLLFVANHEDSGQAVQRVTLTGNSTVTGGGAVGMPVKIFVAPCWNGDFPTPTCDRGSEPRYTNITITNNTSATGGGVATYAHITTLTQSGNSTPTVNTEDIT